MKTPLRKPLLDVCSLVRSYRSRTQTLTIVALLLLLSVIPAMAASGALYASGSNVPLGILWLGSTETASGVPHGHVWIADANGFCRIDDDGNGNATISTTVCAPGLPGAITAQATWDPSTDNVYIPTAAGIARYTFNESLADQTQESLTGPAANLGQPSVTGLAFGPDGKLYFGFKKDGTISRLTTPGGASQTIEAVGVTSGTHNGAVVARTIFGLAFQGGDLFIDAANFLQRIPFATLFCDGACAADDLNLNIAAVGSNSSNLAFFAPSTASLPPGSTSELVDEFDTVTGNTYQLSGSGISCTVAFTAYTCPDTSSTPIFYAAVVGMTMDQYTQAVYVVDDTSAGATANTGRVIRLAPSGPPAAPPTPDGLAGFISPIAPSVPPSVPGHSATLLASAGLTSPGVVIIGTDVWALDPSAGICRVDAGVLNLGTCVVLGGIPGQSYFDPATNLLYVPDKAANSRGVWRVPYNPASRALNGVGASLVAANKGLGGNQPLSVVLGPDASLYVGFNKNGNVLRITAPSTNTNTVSQVGQSTDGHGVFSLAWISTTITDGFGNPQTQNRLYLLQTTALTYVTGAETGAKSKTAIITPMKVATPVAMVSDLANVLYVAKGGEIDTYTQSTQASQAYSVGSSGPPLTFFGKITGIALSGGIVYVGDDPSGTGAPGQGRLWID